jgi:hypothetical protein
VKSPQTNSPQAEATHWDRPFMGPRPALGDMVCGTLMTLTRSHLPQSNLAVSRCLSFNCLTGWSVAHKIDSTTLS